MTIEDMCIRERGFFRNNVSGNSYCNLRHTHKNVHCKYLGKRENDLFVCNYDRVYDVKIEVRVGK